MNYSKDGDGYLVTDEATGRAVCRVKTTELVTREVDRVPGPGTVQQTSPVALPREKWLFHFCAGRFTGAQLAAVLKDLPAS